jgi:Asparagine synthase
MIAAKHFFVYLPSGEPDRAQMEQLSAAFQSMGYRTVEQSFVFGIVPFSADENLPQHEFAILHITPGTEIANRSNLRSQGDEERAKALAFDTVRVFNLLSCEQDSVTIRSDPLSLLPYYMAQVGQGILVCSSIRHIFSACPEMSQELDDQGVFEFLCCGTALGARTLHKYIRLSGAGQVIQWVRGQDLRIDRSGRTKISPANASMVASVAADQIAEYVRESLGKLPSHGLLTLTGGFDSRLIACFATSLKLSPRMVTLGYPRHDEIRVAQAVAQMLNSTTTVFPPPQPDVLELLPLWLECVEGLADVQVLFIANLLSFPEKEGTAVYHGFIGDTLSGALLDRIPIETASTPEAIAKGAAAYFFGGISPQAGEVLQLSASITNAVQDIQTEMVTNVAPHQTFTLWNLENIQRRFVGNQLLYVGRRFMPAPVFYYRPLMELWLSVPRMALDNRTLLKYVFQRHFAKIATLPHAEHVPSTIPRSIQGLKYLSGWLSRRYGARILGKVKFNTEKMDARSYIWSLWHGTTPHQRMKELQGLEETLSLLRSRFGWNAPQPTDILWATCSSLERKQLLMLRRLYLLGEYVKSLPEPISPKSS